ncbi:MAG: EAL domain-containing protein [Nitrosomonadales bacterium]|nr:EAL domain-containing protein [Nitrosomonadales bacterium]
MEKWIPNNTKARRNQYTLLLVLAFFPCVLLFSLYYLYRNIDSLETTLHHNVAVLSSKNDQIDNAHHAQTAFGSQMRDWKNILLRGHDAQDMQIHLKDFMHHEAVVRNSLEAMFASALGAHEENKAADLKSILDSHQFIGKQYRDALATYSLANNSSAAFQIDRMVKGIDRSFSEQLAHTSEDAEQEYKGLAARITAAQADDIEQVQGRVELNLIFITLIILADALLILRTVSKSARELNQLADESEKTVYQLAYSDPLTELPNRRLFQDRLEHAIALSNRTKQYRALMFLDMDNFKTLNDTKGHGMGDLLLIEVANRLKACVRVSDTLARLGGDEFVVLLGELSENEKSASEQASMIAEKISIALSQPYQLNQLAYKCSASIGVTMFGNGLITIEEVHKRADAAMYQAKNAGRNTVRFYDPHTQAALEARSELEHALRLAIEQQQLHLFFQVQVDANNQPVGAEALLRWMHPEMGMVFPGQFITIAEETGLILPIGQWVMETACKQIKLWEDHPQTRNLQLAVNVSARQFHQPDFVAQVDNLIKQTGIKPSRLKLELTESMVLVDVTDTVAKMHALKHLGVRFSMDDFGTGYSSLSYLSQLPLDQLKVDQSFVRNIGIKSSDAVIVQTIIGMANNLNMESIAEGVETQAQRDFLEQAGCKRYQGYLFGKPEPLEKFKDSLITMRSFAA